MSYHLSYKRLRMAGLDDCNTLQPGRLVRSRLGGAHASFSVQNLSISQLHMFKSQPMCHANDEHLAQIDLKETRVSRRTRYPCNSGRSRSSNVWLGEPRLYAARAWHLELITSGKNPHLNKLNKVLIQMIKDFECSMS
jgi:hypothetical protein